MRMHAAPRRRNVAALSAAALLTGTIVAASGDSPGGGRRRSRAVERLPARQRRQARHQPGVRQRALLPGQPQRPVRPRADAAPAELPEVQRHRAVQHPHPADRAHRRRQPDHLHRPVRRPARPAGEQHLQDLQPGRLDRPGGLVRVLDVAGLRHRQAARPPATTPRRPWRTRRRSRRRRPTPASRPRRRGCRSPGPAARSATSPPPTWCWRTPRSTCRPCSGRPRPRSRSTTPTRPRSRTRRPPTTSGSRCTAPRAMPPAPTPRR